MAVAKYHILVGSLTYIGFAISYYSFFNSRLAVDMLVLLADAKWMTLGLFMALFGSTLPDYDLLYKYLSPWHHRSLITHSALIPATAILIYFYPAPIRNYALLLVPFMIGFTFHLFLDLFPNTDVEKLLKEEKYWQSFEAVLKAAEIGLTEQKDLTKEARKRLRGTYNIHLPRRIVVRKKERKTLSPDQTRIWLTINGSIVLVLAFVLFQLFAPVL